jgi:hypothetical protein
MQTSAIEPIVLAFRRATPSQNVFARCTKLKDGRRWFVPVLRRVAFFERVRAMQHPDIAMGIRGRSTDTTQQHALRHGGEICVNFENRQDRAST